jgi:hypothetical protein
MLLIHNLRHDGGYHDANDADGLADDPIQKLLLERDPPNTSPANQSDEGICRGNRSFFNSRRGLEPPLRANKRHSPGSIPSSDRPRAKALI